MKIWIELPDTILEEDEINNLSYLTQTLRQHVASAVKNQLVEKYMEKAEFGDLGITKKELKKAVIERMAEKALEEDD